MKDDYYLWKSWWYAAMYGMGQPRRMKYMDNLRKKIAQ